MALYKSVYYYYYYYYYSSVSSSLPSYYAAVRVVCGKRYKTIEPPSCPSVCLSVCPLLVCRYVRYDTYVLVRGVIAAE